MWVRIRDAGLPTTQKTRKPIARKTPIQRPTKPIAPVSKAKSAQRRLYTKLAAKCVSEARKRGKCPVWEAIPELHNGFAYGHPISGEITECHHRFGRIGRLLLWEPGFMGVSKLGHRWIHAHPEEAIKRGWLAPVGCYNDFDRAQVAIQQPPFSG